MKKEYDFWANKRNIPNLELYTKLIGNFCLFSGINFLLVFLYGKYIVHVEYTVFWLILSAMMFFLTPLAMTDPKKGNRDLLAVIGYGVVHGICTIGSVIMIEFWILLLVYGLELLFIILVIVRDYRSHRRK